MTGGDPAKRMCCRVIRLQQLPSGIGVPGQEADALLLAPIQHFLMTSVTETVSILDSYDIDKFARCFYFGGRYFVEADVANLALLLHPLQRAERFFERRTGVDPVELVEIDALKLETPQAHFDTLDEIAGAAHVLGLGWALASNAALGRDHDALRVGRQGLADQALGNLRAVGVGCVDQGHAQFNSTAQDAASLGGIGRDCTVTSLLRTRIFAINYRLPCSGCQTRSYQGKRRHILICVEK